MTQNPCISNADRRSPTPESRSQSRCATAQQTSRRMVSEASQSQGTPKASGPRWKEATGSRAPCGGRAPRGIDATHLNKSPYRKRPCVASLSEPPKQGTPNRRAAPGSARPARGPNLERRREPYFTALIMSKIGKYIATIIPPTTTPSTTIMIGSIAASSASTAVSTSSS